MLSELNRDKGTWDVQAAVTVLCGFAGLFLTSSHTGEHAESSQTQLSSPCALAAPLAPSSALGSSWLCCPAPCSLLALQQSLCRGALERLHWSEPVQRHTHANTARAGLALLSPGKG